MSANETSQEYREPPKFKTWWIITFLIVWVGIGIAPKFADDPGPFGDMFGMVNSLFSGAALLGLIYTIRLQMHELSLQRKELKSTRTELQKSAEAQKDSAEALALQVLISAISAQLSTQIARRETAFALKRKNEEDIRTRNWPQAADQEALKRSDEAIRHLTAQIDTLHARLSEYDAQLTAKLVEAQTGEAPAE
jgi:hypothetical protein